MPDKFVAACTSPSGELSYPHGSHSLPCFVIVTPVIVSPPHALFFVSFPGRFHTCADVFSKVVHGALLCDDDPDRTVHRIPQSRH